MMSYLGCFATMSRIFSIVIYGLIAIIVCICLGKLLQSEGGKKLVFYVVSIFVILGGVFSGIGLYKNITATSYINGEIDIRNMFIAQSFDYKSSSVVFYEETEGSGIYVCEVDLTKVENFDGKNKEYQVVLNEKELFNATFKSGEVDSEIEFDFYDVEDNLICKANLDIQVQFLNNKTKLRLATTGNVQKEYLTQYFEDYGIRLQISELKGVSE